MKKFFVPNSSDKRIIYAKKELENSGFVSLNSESGADFILLGVNPDKEMLNYDVPVFAGNVSKKGVFDYTKNEAFAIKNAYLTAEAAIAEAIRNSDFSLVNAPILITGYGRIAKALHRYLSAFSSNITICARNAEQRALAQQNGAKVISFENLFKCYEYSFIFNTVPHPVFTVRELVRISTDAVLIDLASFPGGVDKHFAKHFNINLIEARGLPAKFSAKTAGEIVADTVIMMIKEKGL